MRKILDRFCKNDRGNAAIFFTLVLVPFTLTLGVGFDLHRASNVRSNLQSAVDSAALAGAINIDSPSIEREQLVSDMLTANWRAGSYGADLVGQANTVFSGDTVSVSMTAAVPATFALMENFHSIPVTTTASAENLPGQIFCMLALNSTKKDAILLSGSSSLLAEGCAVHSNSSHAQALTTKGTADAEASDFCAVGGYSGNGFSPEPSGNCAPVEDPYANLPVPDVAGCDYTNIQFKNGIFTADPGIYCGGLSLQADADVSFNPGLYVIKGGELSLLAQSTAIGNDVTFYFYGADTGLNIQAQSGVNFSAPGEGVYSGLVFVQHPDSNPQHSNTIIGGGDVQITGTLYFPTQILDITGGGGFGAVSPVMALIADSIIFSGNGEMKLSVDHEAAGFPEVLPRTPGSVRLTH